MGLETMNLDWEQNSKVGNSESRLKTQIVDWKQIRLKTYYRDCLLFIKA